jgi:hypothetical protein
MRNKPNLRHQHYIVGYGSLLSHDSRLTHSGIDEIAYPLELKGWQRSWVTRSEDEKQTYVGATKKPDAVMNGALIPTHEITPELEKRESDYRFTALVIEDFAFTHSSEEEEYFLKEQLKGKSIWLCETLKTDHPENSHPVNQSYVDTCLVGCLEIGGAEFAQQFIEQTEGWEFAWVDDRQKKRYPRYAKVNHEEQQAIDDILKGILHHRMEAIG